MSKVTVFTPKQKKTSKMTLPKKFSEKENMVLLAQAIRVYEDSKHPNLSKTKTRGEITASTRKIYRQKGLGLARHGAKSAPIFVKGGIAHGPKGLKRKLSLPKKMKKKALLLALSLKTKERDVVVVSGISKIKKTKEAQKFLDTVIKKEKKGKKPNKFTIVLSNGNKDAMLFFRNIKNVEVLLYETLNAHNVFYGGFMIFDKEAIKPKRKTKKKGKKK